MRKRLRDMPSQEELSKLYATPHDHVQWRDHLIRADVTVAIGSHLPLEEGSYVTDLSCGNGYIATEIARKTNTIPILGDYAWNERNRYTGPIEESIELIAHTELFVCSETIEHLDDPDTVLARIKNKSEMLILSTPEDEKDDSNPEHIWAWDSEDVMAMLENAGWDVLIHTVLDLRPAGFLYAYQIWVCD